MPFINFTNPLAIILGVILFLLVLYLGKETKKSWILAVMLFAFIALLVGHSVEFVTVAKNSEVIRKAVVTSVTMDFVFIFLSFISYLWVDDIETKLGKRKSIDDSLNWFWNKV